MLKLSKLLIILIVLSFSTFAKSADRSSAIRYSTKALLKQSETARALKDRLKFKYNILFSKNEQKLISLSFSIIEAIEKQQIGYKWEF